MGRSALFSNSSVVMLKSRVAVVTARGPSMVAGGVVSGGLVTVRKIARR